MPRRIPTERALPPEIQEWVDGYRLPHVEDLFEDLQNKISEAIGKDLGELFANDDDIRMDLCIWPSDEEPGILRAVVGGEQSSLTPHALETQYTIEELAQEISERFEGDLQEWREHFAKAVTILDRAIQKANPSKPRRSPSKA